MMFITTIMGPISTPSGNMTEIILCRDSQSWQPTGLSIFGAAVTSPLHVPLAPAAPRGVRASFAQPN